MSKAEELLDSLSIEDIQPFTSEPDIEGHIVIDKDRIIHVPTELKRIAVQYDANIETVTFDCPRYWDEHDLSQMNIYINYKLPGNLINNIGQSLAKNVRINEDDENIINFDWTIGPILTNNKGDLPFSVCAKSKTNQDSDEAIRWYTEINTELIISEGMDGSGDIEDNYEDLFPDVINDIISKLEGINATYDEKLEAFNTNATSKTESFDTNAETKTTEFNNNATTKTNEFNSNAIEKTEAFNTNANGVLKKSNAFINGLMNAALTNEVEGVENVINDGIECPLFKMEVDGHTNEQVVTTGKNLFDSTVVSSNSGLIAKVNDDFSITVTGTPTASYAQIVRDKDYTDILEDGETYTISQDNPGYIYLQIDASPKAGGPTTYYTSSNSISKKKESFTVDKQKYNYKAKIQAGTISSLGENVNFTSSFQLEKGSSATAIEPYTNRIPSPSPDYEQPINSIEGSLEFACRGKNLFDCKGENQSINGRNVSIDSVNQIITVDGIGTNSNSYYFRNNFSNFKPGVYTITIERISGSFTEYTQGSNWAFLLYPFGSKLVNLVLTTNNMDKAQKTITITSDNIANVKESSLWFGWGPDSVSGKNGVFDNLKFRIQIEKGTQATEYEPYVEPNEVTFNLNDEKLRSVGDVKDELVVDMATGDYYKVENVGEVVLDGSTDENWANVPDGTGKERYTSSIIQNLVYTGTKLCQSNYFKSSTSENYYEDGTIRIAPSGGVSIYDDLFTSVDNCKQWLSTHNTIVDYILKTPTTKKLGTLDADQLLKLATFKGYNYMTVTGIVDGELVNLNSRITYIQNANDYREIQNGKIAKMISNHPKQSMEGIDNTFDDAVDMELFELGGDGKSEQVVTSGSNKLGLKTVKVENMDGKGIDVTFDEDGTITLNGTVTSSNLNHSGTYAKVSKYTPNKNYTFSSKYISGSTTGSFNLNIRGGTTEEDTRTYQLTTNLNLSNNNNYTNSTNKATPESVGFITGIQIMANVGVTFNNLKLKLWYNEGDIADEFEPYTGGQPSPSPDYPQPINSIEGSLEFACRGKNLFDKNSADDLLIYPHTDRLNSTTDNYSAIFKCQPNTIYSISKTSLSKTSLIVCGTKDYPKIGDFPLNRMVYGNSNIANGYKTTPDTNYLIIRYYNPEDTLSHSDIFNTIMIEKDSQATSTKYEPYIEPNKVTFNLGEEKLRSVGDVKDELVVDLDTGDYYKVENIGEIIVDDSYDISKSSNTKIDRYAIKGNKLQNMSTTNRVVISNVFLYGFNEAKGYCFNNLANSILCNYKIYNESTLDDFKQFIIGKIFNYILQKPTTKKLGTLSAEDLAKLKTFKGYNNVTVNTNLGLMNIRFIYGLDIKKYVDNKIAELSAQMIEEG